MYQFTGVVKVFNGRFWRQMEVREKASTLQAATAAATRNGIKELKRRWKIHRIEAVSVTLERLGPVLTTTTVLREACPVHKLLSNPGCSHCNLFDTPKENA